MELGPLLNKNLYKFATRLHACSVHIVAIAFVGNKFSWHYCVLFNHELFICSLQFYEIWCKFHFFFARTKSLNFSFPHFFKTSGIFATSLEIRVSQHIVSICAREMNSFECRIFKFFTFFSKLWQIELGTMLHYSLQCCLQSLFSVCALHIALLHDTLQKRES